MSRLAVTFNAKFLRGIHVHLESPFFLVANLYRLLSTAFLHRISINLYALPHLTCQFYLQQRQKERLVWTDRAAEQPPPFCPFSASVPGDLILGSLIWNPACPKYKDTRSLAIDWKLPLNYSQLLLSDGGGGEISSTTKPLTPRSPSDASAQEASSSFLETLSAASGFKLGSFLVCDRMRR